MAVTALEHVLVLSDDIDATRDFYRDVVGLRVGERPALEFPGYWLYARQAGPACLHVADRAAYLEHAATLGLSPGQRAGAEAETLDHIAFDARDYEATSRRIEQAQVDVVHNTVPGVQRQLFVHDPNGVRVEINVKSAAPAAL